MLAWVLKSMLCNSMDWFLYHNGLRHERVKTQNEKTVNPAKPSAQKILRTRKNFTYTKLPQ